LRARACRRPLWILLSAPTARASCAHQHRARAAGRAGAFTRPLTEKVQARNLWFTL
jgi:hypothetical protein